MSFLDRYDEENIYTVLSEAYKSNRKYRCPFCQYMGTREQLVTHVDKYHEELIPEDYTAARVVFNHINKRTTGTCRVCKKETKWNEKLWKYQYYCDDPKCKETLVRQAEINMRKATGKSKSENLKDPERQKRMLSGRTISGKYKFTDGTLMDYVGTYELKCLEFMDKVLNIPSKDLMSPGPVIYYKYKDEEKFYLPDLYYIPANLIIEIKDGGNNPNTRNMEEYRGKQLSKEKAIIEDGKYNYIRLTNNEFDQLLNVLADIKYSMIDDNSKDKRIIHINEEVGGIPPAYNPSLYIVQYGKKNNVFDKIAITPNIFNDQLLVLDNNRFKLINKNEELKDMEFTLYEYVDIDISDKVKDIVSNLYHNNIVEHTYLFDLLDIDKIKEVRLETKLSNSSILEETSIEIDYTPYRNDDIFIKNVMEDIERNIRNIESNMEIN